MKTVDGYNHRARAIVDKLNREFPALKLDFESLKVSGREVAVSRNTLARLLVAHLQNSISIKDVLKKHVFVKEDDSWMMSPEESFKLITDAGGIPILAHSGRELRRLGPVNYEHMIARLVESGLSGLEVHYPKHTVEEIKIMKNIAYQYNLYTTGGSDWHGNMYTPDSELGREFSEEDVIPFLNDKKITAIA